MHSQTLFVVSIICSELKVKSAFRIALYTLLGFANDENRNKVAITINTLINILNRKNTDDKLNRRKILSELDRYLSTQVENGVELFSYAVDGMELEISLPILNLVEEIINLAKLEENFATSPLMVIESIARQIIRERMNPVVETPKPKPTIEFLVNKLSSTTSTIFNQFNEMLEQGQATTEEIREQMTSYLNSTTEKVIQLSSNLKNGTNHDGATHSRVRPRRSLAELPEDELAHYKRFIASIPKISKSWLTPKSLVGAANNIFNVDPNLLPKTIAN